MNENDYPVTYRTLRPGGTPLTRRLLGFAGDLGGKRVLDLACGRGETASLLALEYGSVVTGADISEEMIAECSKACPEGDFVICDASELPFEGGSFDVLVCECSFSVFTDTSSALSEACRVLVSGGLLLVSDLWQRGGLEAGSGMVRKLYTRYEWEELLRKAGFEMRAFEDTRDELKHMYVQMILDEGREEALRKMGLCLDAEQMKKVSYMLLSAEKKPQKSPERP
ncbi:MAG: class I SAM-dependent methyltransferase [Eubacteriaceae bacterium]|nr:class I SAM-dependent methyltransferase [Eubacteriaceae bacterium]